MVPQTSATPAHAMPAQIAGRFDVVRRLGRGGMGSVFEVVDRTTDRRMALKLLHADSSAPVATLFEQEFRTLVSLRHPRIVEVFDYGTSPDGAYYTMELLEGSDLASAAPLPYREVCACLRDAASILGVLHARELIHRDLSPRNLWRTKDGRIKLIDFGALASFGIPDSAVGTPPLMAPEAARGAALDQRSDLYSLGALGYWLLSGVHAFPARSMAELEACWAHSPPSFAALAKSTRNPALEDVPAEVGALVLRLLRLRPEERIQTTNELVDRLNVAAGLDREQEADAVSGYLRSQAFVGRDAESALFDAQLARASGGDPQTLFVEGPAGSGRSRLLHELATQAQLKGATTLRVAASEGARPYTLALRLCEALLRSHPDAAASLASHGRQLAQLSPRLAEHFAKGEAPAPLDDARELRHALQSSLQGWFQEVSRQRPLVLLVDDLDLADEPSAAWFASLARSPQGHRLSLVCSVCSGPGCELDATLSDLRSRVPRATLPPLSQADTARLLASMFGDVPYLERFAERLHRACHGHPAHCLELSHYLVDSGVVRYAEGGWSLPRELDTSTLPSRSEQGRRRLRQLGTDELSLARTLSVAHHGALTGALCRRVSTLDEPTAQTALDELLRAGVLVGSEEHYRFAHDSLRTELSQALDAHTTAATHRRFADALLSLDDDDPLPNLSAAAHLLHAGDLERALPLLNHWCGHILRSGDIPGDPMPALLEECVAKLKAHGAPAHGLFAPVTVLACCGFLVHYRYADRHADHAQRLASQVLCTGLSTRLSRFVGGKLALLIALLYAAIRRTPHRAYALSIGECARAAIQCATWQLAIGATTLDPGRTRQAVRTIGHFAALGERHAAGVAHRMGQAFVHLTQGQFARYNAVARSLYPIVSSQPIEGMPAPIQARATAGVLTAIGSTDSFRAGDSALASAEAIDALGPAHGLSADQIRLAFHLSRGDRAQAEHYRHRVELHAIQQGTCWQMEIWASVGMLRSHILNRDALAVKRSAQDLARVADDLPSLRAYSCWGEGEYLLMHGKYEEALQALDGSGYPVDSPALLALKGAAAAALRGLGRYQEALDACLDGLATLDPQDFEFVLQNQSVRIEHALALAGLGRPDEGRAELSEMRERYADGLGPVLEGKLCEAIALLELSADDRVAAAPFILRAQERYRSTGMPSLIAHADALARLVNDGVRDGDGELAAHFHQGVTDALISQLDELMLSAERTLHARAEHSLRVVTEVTEATSGFIVWADPQTGTCSAFGDAAPAPSLLDWARQELDQAEEDDETQLVELGEMPSVALDHAAERDHEGTRFRLLILRTGALDGVPVGALVLGFKDSQARALPHPQVLEAIARRLVEAQSPAAEVVVRSAP